MTAIEFENISKQYRLGLVSTGTLSHDLNRFWQTKVLRREDPYLKVGEVNDRAHKGASEYVWALKDINLQKPLSLGHGQTSLAAALAHRVFKVEQGDVVGIIGRNGAIMGMSRAEITLNTLTTKSIFIRKKGCQSIKRSRHE